MPDRPPPNPTLPNFQAPGRQRDYTPREGDVYADAALARALHGNATTSHAFSIAANPPGNEAALWSAVFGSARGG